MSPGIRTLAGAFGNFLHLRTDQGPPSAPFDTDRDNSLLCGAELDNFRGPARYRDLPALSCYNLMTIQQHLPFSQFYQQVIVYAPCLN